MPLSMILQMPLFAPIIETCTKKFNIELASYTIEVNSLVQCADDDINSDITSFVIILYIIMS